MSRKRKVSVVFGTRPEAIKLCPVILALKQDPMFDCHVCVTGQHKEMLYQVLETFGVSPDVDLGLMCPNQSLGGFTARAIDALDHYFLSEQPEFVVVQGDTTTVLAGALSAFYHHIPVAHVEAGLRTGNMQSPWPEEANRILTTRLAKWHFCPTESNRKNLLKEGVDPSTIYVTGNTVIDALLIAEGKVRLFKNGRRRIVITGHRRENFGKSFEQICHAIKRLALEFNKVDFIYPVHLNPNVQEPVRCILGGLENVKLLPPQPYLSFVELMKNAELILTDSGGVQEEAPSLGKPVLVMRDTTERPEAVVSGTVKLVGTTANDIYLETKRLLVDRGAYLQMARSVNPYGDGRATGRIVQVLRDYSR